MCGWVVLSRWACTRNGPSPMLSTDVVNLRRAAFMSPPATQGPPGADGSVTRQTSQASHFPASPSNPPGQPTGACLRSGSIGVPAACDDAVSAEAVTAAMITAMGLLNTTTH